MKPPPRGIGASGGLRRASFRRAYTAGCAGLLALAGALMSDPAAANHCAVNHLGVVDSLRATQEGGRIRFEFDNYVPAADPVPIVGFRVERSYWIGASRREHIYSIEDTTSPVYLDIDDNRDTFTPESFTVTNSFAIAAYCLDGNTERSGSSYPGTFLNLSIKNAPGAPRNLRSEAGETTVTLTWEAPDTTNSKFASVGYTVERLVDGARDGISGGVTELTHTDTGLTTGTTYEYRVTSLGPHSWEGGASSVSATPAASDCATDHLGAVDSLTVTQEGGRIKFEFDNYVPAANPFPIVGFRIRKTFFTGLTRTYGQRFTQTNSPIYLDIEGISSTSGFPPGSFAVPHFFDMAAYCTGSDGRPVFGDYFPTPARRASVKGPPLAPLNLSAEVVSETSIALTWEAPAAADNNVETVSYSVERLVDGSTDSTLGTISGLTHTDTGLTSGTTYEYRVASVGEHFWEGGESRVSILLSQADPDVNGDGAVSANDALILYYSYSLRGELGNGR